MQDKNAETTKEEVKTPEAPAKEAVVKEPQTLEEALAKIKALEEVLGKSGVEISNTPPVLTPEEYKKQKAQREKQMKYFKELSRGAKFIEFIIEDLNRGGFNREKRRRIIKQLFNKQFSREFVQMYENKVEQIIAHLDKLTQDLEKQAPAKPVDAAEIFEQNPDGSLKVKEQACDCNDECKEPDACKKEAPKAEPVVEKVEENK